MPKIEVKGNGPYPNGITVLMDGHPVNDLIEFRLSFNRREFPVCEITISPTQLDVDHDALMILNTVMEYEND